MTTRSLNMFILAFLGILLVGIIVLVLATKEASADTLTVDDDGSGNYTKIQDAIDAAEDGDTIRVFDGTYYENVVVNKTVNLIGNGSANTTIDGGGSGTVVKITADRVNISGFMVTGSGSSSNNAGIIIESSNNTVMNNTCSNSGAHGIYLKISCSNTISNNTFNHNNESGIYLYRDSNNNTFTNNTVSGNSIGIHLRCSCRNNTAHHNNIIDNGEYGINASDNDGYQINATRNFWGINLGPYHPEYNTKGKGNRVTDHVEFSPWLDENGNEFYYDFTVSSPDYHKAADPKEFVYYYLDIVNNGTGKDNFTLNAKDVPSHLVVLFPDGTNTEEVEPDNKIVVKAAVLVEENTPSGRLFFNITVASQADHRLSDKLMFTLDANRTYDVEVTTDQSSISDKDPGENATFIANIKNTGNTNETFQLSLLSPTSGNDARDWATIEEGDQIVIMPGETRAVHVEVNIPEFSVENDDAQMGDYRVRLQAYPLNDDSKKKTVEFTIGVDDIYDLRIKSDTPGKNEDLEPEGDTILFYTVAIRNLANTRDSIDVTVPSDQLSGQKKNWEPKFDVAGSTNYQTVLSISNMDSLAEKDITMQLRIDEDTKEGQYTLLVKAKSQGDTSVYQSITLYVNLSKTKFEAKIWADNPGKNSTLKANEDIEMTFILYIRNMGEWQDTFDIFVPSDEFPEDYDWKVYFGISGTKTEKTITLPSLYQATETIRIIIDKKTDEGNYELRVKA
ncbi:MAG: right-handed parallel beta-helix repeat-containing protein, partial [Thermoplasmata archaeon]|nr:right-handed parallel beta-helix repeat-containing protein [Thermoplasmata archaeon]